MSAELPAAVKPQHTQLGNFRNKAESRHTRCHYLHKTSRLFHGMQRKRMIAGEVDTTEKNLEIMLTNR